MTAPLVLVVDDEEPLRRFLRAALQAHDYRVAEAADLKNALLQATAKPPDAVVLDLGLPDGDGLDFIRQLRGYTQLPILVLTARGQEADKVHALDAGADDYLTKPFGMPELLARLRVALRHAARLLQDRVEPGVVLRSAAGEVHIDLGARTVIRHAEGQRAEVKLTATEFKLLAVLAQYAGKVLTHAFLLREVWGPGHDADFAYLRVFMGQLRHKLEPEPAQPRWLLTELGVGYRLQEEPLA